MTGGLAIRTAQPSRWFWGTVFVLVLLAWTAALLRPVPATETIEEWGGQGATFYISKIAHVFGYAFLTILASRLVGSAASALGLLFLLLVHGAGAELLQGFTGRHPSWRDVGLDLIGISLGLGLTWSRWGGRLR